LCSVFCTRQRMHHLVKAITRQLRALEREKPVCVVSICALEMSLSLSCKMCPNLR
jgi:hypothetical protein